MNVMIRVIPHQEQRYETCGDWQVTPEGLLITVSKLGNIYQELSVAVHELVEAMLCLKDGVSQYDVDQFDMEYEAQRKPGDASEPGDSCNAPYHTQHKIATSIEEQLISELGIKWEEYEEVINSL